MTGPHATPGRDRENALREQGLNVVMRLVALLRTARSYAIGNQVFTRQLEQLLEALQPVFAEHGAALVVELDGDVHLNGVRLPLRQSSLRFVEQAAAEFKVREIAGVEFRTGLSLAELESFMRYFLPSELYKGAELHHACATQGFRHALTVESIESEAVAEPADEESAPEREPAVHAFARALQTVHVVLGDGSWRRGLELRHLKRVVLPVVDAAFAGVSPATALATVRGSGSPAWDHAVRVCVVAVAVGRQLGLDRAALSELGTVALLHDAGKPAMAARVRHSAAERGPAERAEAENHTVEGLRAIARSTTLNATAVAAMRVALEHHAGGPEGYPSFSPGWEPSVAARIVGLADAFVSLLEPREGAGPPPTPYEALGRVLGPLAPRFHPGARAALVRALGVYPPGQVIELDDGSVVRVLGSAPEDPEHPLVEWLTMAGGRPVPPGWMPAGTLPPELPVRRALPRSEWPAPPQAA
jgi:HD-GYP domain-containing protein (c-di-GMP phosphodiesterase class II)